MLVQTGQKFVREIVVGYLENGGLKGALPSTLLTLIAIAAAILLIKRVKWGIGLAIFTGGILLMQPIVYHYHHGEAMFGRHLVVSFFHSSSGIIYPLLFCPDSPEGKGDSELSDMRLKQKYGF